MTDRHDADHRLGRGLKRWAEAGQPTVDLEAYVKARTPAPAGGTVATAVVGASTALKHRRRWLRLAAGVAAAAALALAITATFPSWAGAASHWPLVGPVVTEIILKDAGLKWAYDNGLIQGTVAEAKDGDVTIRILGAMADSRQTTVIYQIIGLRATDKSAKPLRVGSAEPPTPAPSRPDVAISKIDGQGGVSWSGRPLETPVGLVGTVSTMPLKAAAADVVVSVRFGEKTVELPLRLSRAEADKFSREVAVNRSQEIDGVKVTVESVTYTPAETIIRYREEGPLFSGPVQRDPKTEWNYIENGGKRYQATGSMGVIIGGVSVVAYPPVKGPITFVMPVAMKGIDANLVWPLRTGATQQASDIAIELTRWSQTGNWLQLDWESGGDEHFVGIARFEALDAAGQSYPLGEVESGESNNLDDRGRLQRGFYAPLPPGVTPVAVRAKQTGYKVIGPWRFELPQ